MEKDLILAYLQPPQVVIHNGKLMWKKSSLSAGLIEARGITGRNINTGDIEDFNKSGSWAGAILYMVCVDHIGSLFAKENDNDFCGCLREFNFYKLSENEILALYALRNAFIHDFGLFNIKRDKKGNIVKNKTHSFVVTKDRDKPIVILPEKNWDGEIKNHWSNKTLVNLYKLAELVETIYKDLLIKAENGTLVIYDRKNYRALDKIDSTIIHQV